MQPDTTSAAAQESRRGTVNTEPSTTGTGITDTDTGADINPGTEPPTDPATTPRPPGIGDRALRWWTVLAVLAVTAGGVLTWQWWSAAHDPALRVAATRDVVLAAARPDLVVLNTLDYRNPVAGMDNWLGVSTGALHDELSRDKDVNVTSVRQAKTTSTATVREAGATAVDPVAGTATVDAVLDVTLTVDGRAPANRRDRFTAELVRTQDGWRISALTAPSPVGVPR